jgi:hypothetical protein
MTTGAVMQTANSPEMELERADVDLQRSSGAAQSTRKIRLGEELPIFCEKCGYALHGLAQEVCERCSIRQFHCPECGHHQPINTLRPAAQKILGRIRAFFLAVWVFLKINFFGWLLVAWVSVGYQESYRYDFQSYSSYVNNLSTVKPGARSRYYNPPLLLHELDKETIIAFSISGFFFGAFGRMLLLRWRRGYLVGLTLAILVCLALSLGAQWRKSGYRGDASLPSPFTVDFLMTLVIAFSALLLGASVVWGIWSALVTVFLPKRTGAALLEWQRSQSTAAATQLMNG